MEYKKNINKNIFRGYDIRGVYPTEIDVDTAYTIGLGFGSYIKELGKTKCIVGHDNRLSSMDLYSALIEGIIATGIDIISLGLCTTPMYYYACIKLNIYSGVMVTASHNPKDDNGFKFAFNESAYILKGSFSRGLGKVTDYDITNDYLELFKNNFNFGPRRVKVVVDPGNGTTSVIIKKLYDMFPIDVVYINDVSDGTFPNHHPDPCVEKNLEQLKEKVLEVGADVGLGFDGDGDRMGFVSNIGEFIPTDKYMIIIVRDIINKVSKKEFLCDVKCSKRTGNSYTKAAVRDMDLSFGGELSGHVYFRDRWPGFDSGLYAGLRLLEILSNTEGPVRNLLSGINNYYATEELKFQSPDDIKFGIIYKVEEYVNQKGYKYLNIDGIKVLFDDGWALVRASNTGPNITARFEASTKERLREIEQEFTNLITTLNK